jgi:hypothetical protein
LHDGFFFRFQFGASAILVKGADTGVGIAQSIGVGGALSPSLVFYGDFSVAADLYQQQKKQQEKRSPVVGGLGAGLLHYFPDNVFIGGALGYGRAEVSGGGTSGGGYLKLEAGREGWVSDDWALGYSIQLLSCLGRGGGAALGALFSATYN